MHVGTESRYVNCLLIHLGGSGEEDGLSRSENLRWLRGGGGEVGMYRMEFGRIMVVNCNYTKSQEKFSQGLIHVRSTAKDWIVPRFRCLLLPPEPSRQEALEDLVMNFILVQEERVKKLEEYMGVIGNDFMELSPEVIRRLKEKIRLEKNRIKKIKKIIRYPDIEGPDLYSDHKFSKTLTKKAFPHAPKSIPTSSLYIRYVHSIFPNPPLPWKGPCGLKFDKKGSQSISIYGEGVTCNIPYWLARYLKRVKEKDLLVGGMFVTRIAKSFGLLINLMVDALSVEPRAHVFRKKSLIAMGIVMDLRGGTCWPATCQVRENDVVEEAANEEACGSVEVYENMIWDDCHLHQARWMDQQDERWGEA
ncbi:hypothetical protein Tco_0517676 [Tanacetum coccineum]